MMDWREDRKTDGALRACGIALCAGSFAALRALIALRSADGHLPPGALPFALAWIGLACACSGGVLLTLGHHVFDEVEIGASRFWIDAPTDNHKHLDPARGEIDRTNAMAITVAGSVPMRITA